MKINDVLHRRQYTINLSSNTPPLDLASLSNMGVWSNPKEKHYILTLTHNDDPINDSSMFEKIFKERTGLQSKDFIYEAKHGPVTLQRAVDSTWF